MFIPSGYKVETVAVIYKLPRPDNMNKYNVVIDNKLTWFTLYSHDSGKF